MTGVTDSLAAYEAWTTHRHYRYRGCAPDVDNPRVAAGNPDLSLDAWSGEDRDGGEPQKDRIARERAAVEVCLGCPVMVLCGQYANSVVMDEGRARLAEPEGIWGGQLGLERHRAFIARRHEVAAAAPVRLIATKQRLRVLHALARHVDAEAVAAAAGVDVRTANWQRSRLTTQLNLDRQSATRAELLRVAVERGLLDGSVVVADDGLVPAVPPATGPAPAADVPVSEPLVASPVIPGGRVFKRKRGPAYIPGQLAFFPAEAVVAPVVPLYPSRRMEAAA
ncbi:hypothetical protein ACWEGQ_00065 [Streptomyces seoulensis]